MKSYKLADGETYWAIDIGEEPVIVNAECDESKVIFPYGPKQPNYWLMGMDGKKYIVNPGGLKRMRLFNGRHPALMLSKKRDMNGWINAFHVVRKTAFELVKEGKVKIENLPVINIMRVRLEAQEAGISL